MQDSHPAGALPGACAQGLIWGIMAIGVYLTYRILDVADLTVDGSFGTGGAVCVMCLLSGMNVWAALFIALLVRSGPTGLVHRSAPLPFMGIPAILAGILTQLDPLLHQPEDHGQGQPVHQCGQVRTC